MTSVSHNPQRTARSAFSRIRRVISACSLPDISIWEIVAERIPLFIPADEYLLICPAAHMADFTFRTPAAWTIVDDNFFSEVYGYSAIEDMAIGANQRRAGWLLQQFVKMNACADPRLQPDDLVLIWDADTIPLRPLSFVDEHTGVIQYYHSREHHMPYFETIRRMMGIEAFASRSFIAQCFATRVAWARELIAHIEQRSGGSYIEHIVRSLPGRSESEFSEYEAMGTWNLTHHPDQMAFAKHRRWTRNGARWIGHRPEDPVASLLLRKMALRYDYVAVEKWQKHTLRPLFSLVSRFLSSEGIHSLPDDIVPQPMSERISQP
jgi:hypothetical protein